MYSFTCFSTLTLAPMIFAAKEYLVQFQARPPTIHDQEAELEMAGEAVAPALVAGAVVTDAVAADEVEASFFLAWLTPPV